MKLLKTLGTALVLMVSLVSCSPRAQISEASIGIRQLAESSKSKFDTIEVETKATPVDLGKIQTLAAGGSKEQLQIIENTDIIATNVPKTNDEVPWIGRVLLWGSAAVVLVTLLLLLLLTPLGRGISALVGNAFSFVSSLLPTPSTKLGQALAKAEDPNEKNFTMEHFTAAAREIDPTLKKAYLRARKKRKSVQPSSSSTAVPASSQ